VQFEWFYNITQQSRQTSAAVSNAGLEVNLWTSEKNRVWWRRQRGRNAFFACAHTGLKRICDWWSVWWYAFAFWSCIAQMRAQTINWPISNKKKTYLYQQNMNM